MQLTTEALSRCGLDLLPVGSIVVDPSLTILIWNRTLADWTGIPSSEAVGLCLTDLYPTLSQGLCEKRLLELFETGLPVCFSATLHKHFLPIPPRRGLPVPRMIQQTEARLLPGVREWAIITIQDVTVQYYHLAQLKAEHEELVATQERMQLTCRRLELANEQLNKTQQSLWESREYADGILCSMVDMLVVFTQDGLVTRVNDATLTKLGYASEELEGRHVASILSETAEGDESENSSEQAFAEWLIERLGREGSVSELECWRRDKQGAAEPVSLSGAVMRGAEGHTLGYVCVLQDTAERKRIQEELARGKRLQSVGQLAAGIAHEINTPLQCISGCLEYLDKQVPPLLRLLEEAHAPSGGLDDRTRSLARDQVPETLTDAMTAVTRVVEIVAAMRSMVYTSTTAPKPMEVNQLVRDAAIISRSRWKEHAQLELDLDEKLPQPLGVAAEISQIVLNLIVNSADALAELHQSGFELGKITVRTYVKGDSIAIEVQDTGPGIPHTIRDRIFEPFFTTKDIGIGTGQGLAFCYQAARRHNGSIELTNAPGAGAQFTVTIPMNPSRCNAEPLEIAAPVAT